MVTAAAAVTIVVIVGKHLIEQSSALFRTPDYRRAVNGLLGSLRNYSLLNRRRTIFYSSFTMIVCERAP